MSIEKEAEEFLKTRQKKTPADKVPEDRTGLRYYMGCALSGLLAGGGRSTRPEEVLEEAAKYAELALQKEKSL
jgi:hypothetical protein